MGEELDKMYQDYLNGRFDLIFEEDDQKDKSSEYLNPEVVLGKNSILFQEYEIIDKYYCGVAAAKKNAKVYLIDSKGDLVTDEWFDVIKPFHGKYAKVKKNNKCNYIDVNGNLLTKVWYDDANSFNNGYAVVEIKKRDYLINEKGILIVKPHSGYYVDCWETPIHGYLLPENVFLGMVKKFDQDAYKYHVYNVIDSDGELLFKKWFEKPSVYDSIVSFVRVNKNFDYACAHKERKLLCITRELNDYVIERYLGKYKCTKDKEKIILKYKPLVIYDSKYVLCFNKETLYLYDRDINRYEEIGDIRDYEFDANCIIKHEDNTVLFIYDGKKIDITSYYHKKLENGKYKVKHGIEIFSKNDYFIDNERKVREEAEEEKRRKALAEKKKNQLEEKRKISDAQKINDFKEKKNLVLLNEAYRSVLIGIKKLEEYEKETGVCLKIDVDKDNLFYQSGDHLEIKPFYLEMGLRHINLSNISFNNVNVVGVDFSGSNVRLNPQEVYERNLSNCNFEGVVFLLDTDFTGVNVKGAKFTTRKNQPVFGINFEINSDSFINSIYDENTTLNGERIRPYKSEESNNMRHNR